MLGSYEATAEAIVFRPRFPLVPGLRYTVRFDPSRIERTGPSIETIVTLPKTRNRRDCHRARLSQRG